MPTFQADSKHTQSWSIRCISCRSPALVAKGLPQRGHSAMAVFWLLKGGGRLPTQECLGFCFAIQTDHVCNEVNWMAESCWPFCSCHLWNSCCRHIEGLKTGRKLCCFSPSFLVKSYSELCGRGCLWAAHTSQQSKGNSQLAIMTGSWKTLLSVGLSQTIYPRNS